MTEETNPSSSKIKKTVKTRKIVVNSPKWQSSISDNKQSKSVTKSSEAVKRPGFQKALAPKRLKARHDTEVKQATETNDASVKSVAHVATPPTPTKSKKAAKRRAPRKEKEPLGKEEKERRLLAGIAHKKAAPSSNWQNFIASSKQNKSVSTTSNEDVKETGFQKGLARKRRKTGLNSEIQPETNMAKPNDIEAVITPSTPSDTIPPPVTPDNIERGVKLTKQIAIDCEMVGVNDGSENMLARVSLVNKYGDCIYDKFVFPKEEVVDYRTYVSGVRPEDLANGESFEVVNKEVGEILKGRILVGHAVSNDLKVLHLPHPKKNIRDTSKFSKCREICGHRPGLKKLAAKVLGINIQEGEHDSVIDARATMQIYMMYRKEWEESRSWHKKKVERE